METLEKFIEESKNYKHKKDFVIIPQEWIRFEGGTCAYEVRTYDSSGNLIKKEYVLQDMDNTHEVLEDMQQVDAAGYYTETSDVMRMAALIEY